LCCGAEWEETRVWAGNAEVKPKGGGGLKETVLREIRHFVPIFRLRSEIS